MNKKKGVRYKSQIYNIVYNYSFAVFFRHSGVLNSVLLISHVKIIFCHAIVAFRKYVNTKWYNNNDIA